MGAAGKLIGLPMGGPGSGMVVGVGIGIDGIGCCLGATGFWTCICIFWLRLPYPYP